MPLLVRNSERNATVFSKNGVSIIWAASGDPMGGDLQRVPDDLQNDVDFLNSVERGILIVEDATDSSVLEKIRSQSAAFLTRRDQAATSVASTLDRRQDRDITQVSCIGPALNGRGGVCGADVLQRAAASGDIPPLCSRHESLAPNFYLAESGSAGENATERIAGKVSKQWKQIAPVR